MKRLFFFLPFTVLSCLLHAQNMSGGAENAGLGGILSYSRNSEALCGNSSGLTTSRQAQIAVFSEIPFGIMAGMRNRFGIMRPLKTGTGALTVSRYGNSNFNINTFSALYAHHIAPVSLGLRFNTHSYNIAGSGSTRKISFDFGGHSQLSENLIFGAYISNFTLSRLAGEASLYIPVIMATGLHWSPSQFAKVSIELVKEPGFPGSVRTGLEYGIYESLRLRGGYSSAPGRIHLGFGVSGAAFRISYASVTHPVLTMSHFLSVEYQL